MTRKEERELAFTLVFEKIFNNELTVEEIVNNAVEARLIEENTFAFSLAQLTYEHCDEIDGIIMAKLSFSSPTTCLGVAIYFPSEVKNPVPNISIPLSETLPIVNTICVNTSIIH